MNKQIMTVMAAVIGIASTCLCLGAATYYVGPSGSDTAEGTSPETPFATIATAVAKARADGGGEVVVLAGTYELTAENALDAAITVRGGTGKPEDVTLNIASGAKSRHFTLNNAEARVASLTLSGGCPASDVGGDVLIKANGGTVSNCVMRSGRSNGWGSGGGGFAIYPKSQNALVTDCVISNCQQNVSGNDLENKYFTTGCAGAAAYIQSGTVRNCLFTKNGYDQATELGVNNIGATIAMYSGRLENCTVVGNYNCYDSGVLAYFWNASATPVVTGCILGENKSALSLTPAANVWSGNADYFTNCVSTAYINDFCTVAPRLFVDAANADYTPEPAAVGFGAIARDTSVYSLGMAVDKASGPSPLTVTFTPTVYGATGGTISWDWDGDGTWDETSSGAIAHTFSDAAANVQAKVSVEGKGEVALVSPVRIIAVSKLYVDPTCATPVAPYADKAHAATTLADAYEIAPEGSEIVLAAGTHAVPSRINVTKGVTIRGETGNPADVTLAGNDTDRLVIWANDGATLSGVTVTKGKTPDSTRSRGGAVFASMGGIFTNCVFSSNQTKGWGGVGGAIYLYRDLGLVTHCRFTGNLCSASGNGYGNTDGGGMAIAMNGGTVRNCLFTGNGNTDNNPNRGGCIRMADGLVESCTFVDNAHTYCAGIHFYNGTARNCVIGPQNCPGATTPTMAYFYGPTASFDHCAASVALNDTCVTTENLFNDYATGDYTPGAALVDRGVYSDWMADATDLAGVVRVSGALPDVGCYEKDQGVFSANISASAAQGISPLEVTYTVAVYGAGAQGVTIYWDWNGDGTWDETTTETTTVHTFDTGVYAVKSKVVDNATQKEYAPTSPLSLTAVPKTLYVDGYSTAPTYPYATPATAAKDVATALAASVDGCEIIVSAGKYELTAQIEITKGVTVRGATGDPEDVILSGNFGRVNVGGRVALINHPDAKLLSVVLQNGHIKNCTSSLTKNGGGCQIAANGGMLSNCVIRACQAWTWGNEGHALYIEEGASRALVTHCVLSNNTEGVSHVGTGGAITMRAGTVRNTLVCGNKLSPQSDGEKGQAGTVYMYGGRLENCTIVKNENYGVAGVVTKSGAEVVNCIIAENTAQNRCALNPDTSAVWAGVADCFTHCLAPIRINDNCITGATDKIFTSFATGDYTVKPTSPAVDAGTLSDWMAGATDLAGAPRVQGEGPDIGCYEAAPAAFAVSFGVAASEGVLPFAAHFSVEAVGAKGELACTWDWDGDGAWDETTYGTTATHVYTTAGAYGVRLKVTDGTQHAEVETPVAVRAVPGKLYVASGNEGASEPYDTPAKAAADIATAVAYATDGCEIEVAAGTYPVKDEITVEKGVWIHSADGKPASVIVKNTDFTTKDDGSAVGINRVFTLNHARAKLSGLTVSDGYIGQNQYVKKHGAGILIEFNGGTVSNCVVRDCVLYPHANEGIGLYIAQGAANALVTHTVFENCIGGEAGRGGVVAMMAGSVRNCLIKNCGRDRQWNFDANFGTVCVVGGTFENCTVVSNYAGTCAGVHVEAGGLVKNTIILGNRTKSSDPKDAVYGYYKNNKGVVTSAGTLDHCIGEVVPEGENRVATKEAVFRSFDRGQYWPSLESPAIDFCETSDWMTGTTDLRGRPRIQGEAPDCGAYERPANGGTLMIVR